MTETSKWMAVKNFLKLMKLDLCLGLFMFGFYLQNVTVTQLMEDKMCTNQLNQTDDYCLTLSTVHATEENAQIVLRQANSFKNYQYCVINLPSSIVSAFLGYWLDKYPNYLKIMVILPLISGSIVMCLLILNAIFFHIKWWVLLISYIPLSLGGGTFLMFSCCYTYISWSTPDNLLIIRFAALEFVVQAGILLATLVSGNILSMKPWFSNQLENYIGVLMIAFACYLIGLALAVLFKLEYTPKVSPQLAEKSHTQVIQDVFQLSTLKEPFAVLFKKRPNNGRLRLILLILSSSLCLASILGEDAIAFQFAQRVYGLSASQYTKMFALATLLPSILTSAGPPIFRSGLQLSDPTIAVIGCTSIVASYLIRGIFLSIPGYIVGYISGSFNKVSIAAFRSLVTVVVSSGEAAKIFILATTIESFLTFGLTATLTSVFSSTIDKHPATVMRIVVVILLFPFAVSWWVRLTHSKWQVKNVDQNVNPNEIQVVSMKNRTSASSELS